MDNGIDTFALDTPPNFQRDLRAKKSPALQLNIDATRVSQAFTGASYIQSILASEVSEVLRRYRSADAPQVDLDLRARFNQELKQAWFGAINNLMSNITMLSIVLTGAALIREREHGTTEHLLVMPAHDGITIEAKEADGGREHARSFIFGLVEKLPRGRGNDGMRFWFGFGPQVIGCQHDPKRLLEGLRRVGQDLGDPGERLLLFGIENVQDDADQKRVTGLFPMRSAFERTFQIDQDIGDVLDVANFGRPLTDPQAADCSGRFLGRWD